MDALNHASAAHISIILKPKQIVIIMTVFPSFRVHISLVKAHQSEHSNEPKNLPVRVSDSHSATGGSRPSFMVGPRSTVLPFWRKGASLMRDEGLHEEHYFLSAIRA